MASSSFLSHAISFLSFPRRQHSKEILLVKRCGHGEGRELTKGKERNRSTASDESIVRGKEPKERLSERGGGTRGKELNSGPIVKVYAGPRDMVAMSERMKPRIGLGDREKE